MNKYTKIILATILSLAILVSGYLALRRYQIETKNKTVEMIMDYQELKNLAYLGKISLDSIIDEVKASGISGVALSEDTLDSAHIAYSIQNPPQPIIVKTNDPEIKKQLIFALGKDRIKESRDGLSVDTFEDTLRETGIGFNKKVYDYLKAKGLDIILRITNYKIDDLKSKIASLPDKLVIFKGKEVLGFDIGKNNKVFEVAQALKENKIKFGYIDVYKQDGSGLLAAFMKNAVVKVNSISDDEIKNIDADEAIRKFTRAVKERNIRLLFIRIKKDDPSFRIEKSLKDNLVNAGYKIGLLSEQRKLGLSFWQVALLSLGVAVGGIFLLSLFIELPLAAIYAILGLTLLGALFFRLMHITTLCQKLSALSAAIIFPSYAVISQFTKKKNTTPLNLCLDVVVDTLLGIILIVGLLADTRFMLGSQVFLGVKLTLVLPILIVLIYFLSISDKSKFNFNEIVAKLNQQIEIKFNLLYILLGIAFVGVLGIGIARSGNFILPVLGIEKIFRNILEALLFVRPRLKEFLIGYPALFLAAVYFLKGEKKWLWLLLAIATIAPTSLTNTFCHIHTPLIVSLIRSLNGLVLGLLIGWIIYALSRRWGR